MFCPTARLRNHREPEFRFQVPLEVSEIGIEIEQGIPQFRWKYLVHHQYKIAMDFQPSIQLSMNPCNKLDQYLKIFSGSVEFEVKKPRRTNFDLHLQPLKRRIVMCTGSIQQWLVGWTSHKNIFCEKTGVPTKSSTRISDQTRSNGPLCNQSVCITSPSPFLDCSEFLGHITRSSLLPWINIYIYIFIYIKSTYLWIYVITCTYM